MPDQTAEERKTHNVVKMGGVLGNQYSELWHQVAIMFINWLEYVELYGTNPERVKLLNQAAPMFFHRLQNDLLDSTLLHICRVTDPPKVAGRDNLTIRNLPDLVANAKAKESVKQAVDKAISLTQFARDWRNRQIAHLDLQLALKRPATPLAEASRKQIREALDAVAAVLNVIAAHYDDSYTGFELTARHNGAGVLLCILEDGVKERERRAQKAKAGTLTADDMPVRRL
jgi:AbiU2